MPIEVPSIWDYLANAGNQGIQSFQQAKERTREQALQNAGLMSQLFQAGAIGSGALQGTLGQVPGLPSGLKVQPSKAEKQATPGTAENLAQQADIGTSKAALQKQDITARWSSGQPVSEEEATIAGLPTKTEFEQMRQAKADPILQQAGTQYIDQAVLKLGGRINPAQASQLAQNAYQQYVKDYQATGQGTLTPAQLKNAQSYFSGRAMQLIIKQREDDTARIQAQNAGSRSAIAPQDRMFAQLTSLLENNRKTMADFLKANPGIEIMAAKGGEAKPAFAGAIARYNRLNQREGDLQNAQAQLAAGIVPKNFSNLLTESVSGGAGTPPPPPPAGDPVAQIKADYRAGKLTAAQIRASTLINQTQKDEILGKPGNINLGKK